MGQILRWLSDARLFDADRHVTGVSHDYSHALGICLNTRAKLFSEWRIRTEQLRSVVDKPTFRDLWEMAAFSGPHTARLILLKTKAMADFPSQNIAFKCNQKQPWLVRICLQRSVENRALHDRDKTLPPRTHTMTEGEPYGVNRV